MPIQFIPLPLVLGERVLGITHPEQTAETLFFHRLQQQVAVAAAVIPAQMAALGVVLVVTVPLLVLEYQGKEIMAALVLAILTHQAVAAALVLLAVMGLAQFLVVVALAVHLPYQAVQLPTLAVVAVLVTTHKATLRRELAGQAVAVMACHLIQMAATELQTRAVVVVEQHPIGLLLSGELAALAL